MNPKAALAQDLRQHLEVCQEMLALAQRENQSLRDPAAPSQFEAYQARKALLPRLDESLNRLKYLRTQWQKKSPAERSGYPEIPPLLRQTQDLIMRILMIDRENEQIMLRRGLVPARHIPPAATQRPHFVADLYRRNQVS